MEAVNVGHEDDCSLLYDELPSDLIEEILAWLPEEYLRRFANVCKQWNSLFSSTSFLMTQWAQTPCQYAPTSPNKNPWLMVVALENNLDIWAYFSVIRSWKKSGLSLSILEGGEIPRPLICHGYGAGLFLIQCTNPNSIYVCNPLTAKYFILPPMADMDSFNFSIDEIGIFEEGKDGYKVLVVHYSNVREQIIVEIYDSTDKAWTMAGVLPRHLMTFDHNGKSCGTVSSGGYFYCLMWGNENGVMPGIMGFNMIDGTSILVELPPWTGRFIYFNQLVHCGSRILFVEAFWQFTDEEEVIIWEFDKDAATKWTEIARMPPTVHRTLNTVEPSGKPFDWECVAVGDCLYFKMCKKVEVAVYNLSQNSWAFLPDCPVATDLALVAFKPRADIKLQ